MSAPHPDDELLAAYTANELSPAERDAFAAHLADCTACARVLQQTQSIRALLRVLTPLPGDAPAPSLADDVLVKRASLGIASGSDVISFGADSPSSALFPDSPDGTARPVLSAPSVVDAESPSGPPREPAIQPNEYGETRSGFRRNSVMDSRTRDIPDNPTPTRARNARSGVRTHSSRPYVAVAAVLVLALLSAIVFSVLGSRGGRGPTTGAHPTATTTKPAATPAQVPGLVIDTRTGLPTDLKDTGFTQVQALGPNDLWGLGYFWQTARSKTTQGVSYMLFGHFNGQKWTIWPVPLANVGLTSFSMDSDTDGWAVGSLLSVASISRDVPHGVLVHFANGAITITRVPGAGQLFSVQMLSATQGWAVGIAPTDGSQPASALSPVTLHYVNGAWSLVPNTLYPEGVGGLSMDSQNHGWLIGLSHLGYLANSRWVQWHQAFAEDYLQSVSSVSPDDAWAVGNTQGSPTSQPSPVVLHFDGHSWSPITIPALSQSSGALLFQVVMTTSTDGWIAGEVLGPLSSGQAQVETAVLLHYNGSQWQSVAPPDGVAFTSISMSSSSDGWAMGWNPPSGSYTYLCHYQHGMWSVVTQFG